MATLEQYIAQVKTGQDLLDLGVVPKTSDSHLALIISLRLQALRDKILAGVDDEMLGCWIPAVSEMKVHVGEVVSDPALIEKYQKEGMKVRGRTNASLKPVQGLEGVIKCVDRRRNDNIGVEWSTRFDEGHNLNGNAAPGKGFYMKSTDIELLVPGGEINEGLKLAKTVVADKQLGHKVKFKAPLKVYAWDNDGSRDTITVPQESLGQLFEYDSSANRLGISFENKIPSTNRNVWRFQVADLQQVLLTSSLGQMLPQDKERTVYEEALAQLFPKTILDTKRAERIAMQLLMARDAVYYGPPGSGKSNVIEDIMGIARQQGPIFIVEGCKVQCNPFSLFDTQYAKVVQPCPECKMKYDPDYRTTGRFKAPKAKDVKVVVAEYGDGRGMESVHGTVAIWPQHLSGFKVPQLDGSTSKEREDAFDPEGFQPGILVRTNNGIVKFDEIDKLPPKTLDAFLAPLNDNTMKPEQLRFTYPAHSLILTTANDHTVIPLAMNDRMMLLAIRRPEEVSVFDRIDTVSYYKEGEEVEHVPLPDTQVMQPFHLSLEIPMPTPIRFAMNSLFMKFDKEYTGAGKNEVMASERSRKDALDGSRAKLYLDRIFFGSTPQIITAPYAIAGMNFAMLTRMQIENRTDEQKAKEELINWVNTEYPPTLTQAENNFWCEAYKHIAIAKQRVPELEQNFARELASYRENPATFLDAFTRINQALQPNASRTDLQARVELPFMDYLFQKQRKMALVCKDQLPALMQYYLKCEEGCSCKVS